jgi:hypothetical protein
MIRTYEDKYIGEVLEDADTGELVIELPIDMLNQMGWDEGTLLEWMVDEETNNVILKEKNDGESQ